MKPPEQPLVDPVFKYFLKEFIAIIPRSEAVAMAEVKGFAVKLYELCITVNGDPKFFK